MIDFRRLIKAGVHFGHQTTRWCPKMASYIWGTKNGVHLIDVSKTASQLEKAAQFLHDIAAEGKPILWVGTKKAARDAIVQIGADLKQPYVYHRWIGGTLSNNSQVKKSVTKLLHYEDVLSKSEQFPHYTKKEFTIFQKMVERLTKNVGGIRNLTWPLGAIVLVDVTKERSALKEASIMGVPVVALVDTNSDPSMVDIVIPGNDDAPKAIAEISSYLAQAVAKGQEVAVQKAKEKPQHAEKTEGTDADSTEKTLMQFEKELAEAEGKKAADTNKRPGATVGGPRRSSGPARPGGSSAPHRPRTMHSAGTRKVTKS
ncbi:MAG TPA: 30S ribosomal protein S2 [Candidatus Limnocylindria bacterium]|nr:30S ribosomal protein S2 [Candidatus Limnocylindria bacterium]